MKNQIVIPSLARLAVMLCALLLATRVGRADPLLTSWLTIYSGQYARVYTNAASQSSGNAVATWSNGTQTQALPAYAGVQEIDSSTNWIYLRTSGLGYHVMGAWQAELPNLPANRKALYRLPRTNSVPTTKSITGCGVIG